MNKWQIICPLVLLLGVGAWLAYQHGGAQHRALASAVSSQLDGHSLQIAELLSTMRSSNVAVIEDAAYQELQAAPSRSLISRSMIAIARREDGLLECVVDTRSLGIAPRTIRASRSVEPAL